MTAIAPEMQGKTAFFFSNEVRTKDQGGVPTFSREDRDGRSILLVKGMPIFRSGEFRDSMGMEHTYDAVHMELIKSNFNLLRDRNILKDVYVRAGHPNPFTNYMHELTGFDDDLNTAELVNPADGKTYTYLLADYAVLDSGAAEKIESGLWRNRSSEIGFYTTNDGMDFWPTLVGFAYVDIPAVEGLNFAKFFSSPNQGFVINDMNTKEVAPVATADKDTQREDYAAPPASPPAPPAPPAAPPAAVEPPKVEAIVFKINGNEIADFGQVQRHISEMEEELVTLRAFEKETIEANRRSFIDGMIRHNKALASDRASLEAFALKLNADQWQEYVALNQTAASLPLFGNHAVSPDAGGTPDTPQDSGDPELEQAKRNFNRLKIGGMNRSDLERTPSFKLLQAKLPEYVK